MIRPLTIASFLLACGSGLYLYQSKHEVQLLDRTIERTVHDTNALREQSRLLAAEWTMLNDPERLRQFSDTYLSLKTITPSQFTSLADLDSRLPAPPTEEPAPAVDRGDQKPEADETAPARSADPEAAAAVPVPPLPVIARVPAVAVLARPADPKGMDRAAVARPVGADGQTRSLAATESRSAEPRASEIRAPEPRAAETRSAEQHAASRPADGQAEVRRPAVAAQRPIVLGASRPQLVFAPVATAQERPVTPVGQRLSGPAQATAGQATAGQATAGQSQTGRPRMAQSPPRPPGPASAPYAGSLLGMARGSLPPAPPPTPVSASFNSN